MSRHGTEALTSNKAGPASTAVDRQVLRLVLLVGTAPRRPLGGVVCNDIVQAGGGARAGGQLVGGGTVWGGGVAIAT